MPRTHISKMQTRHISGKVFHKFIFIPTIVNVTFLSYSWN